MVQGEKPMSIGKTMQEGKNKAIKQLITLAGMIVYVTAIVYAEVHGYTLLKAGIDPGMLIWATIGIFALGITALALPLGLHFAYFDPTQRLTAFIFYGLDLALLMLNAVVDYLRFNAGGEMPGWGSMYLEYLVPLNPVIAGLGWSIILLLDPAQRRRQAIEALKAAADQSLDEALIEAAKATEHSELINDAARQLVAGTLSDTLDRALLDNSRPARLPQGKAAPALEAHPTDKTGKRWQVFSRFNRKRQPAAQEASNGADPQNQQSER
jgi:hypothetical protein